MKISRVNIDLIRLVDRTRCSFGAVTTINFGASRYNGKRNVPLNKEKKEVLDKYPSPF